MAASLTTTLRHRFLFLALLTLVGLPLTAVDYGARSMPLFETEEWSFTDSSVSGEPFYHYGTVVFTHTASGDTRTVTTFYDGGDTWRFRFFAERQGEWTFVSSGDDPDQAGHSGSVVVGAPATAGKLGPIIPHGDRYVRRDAEGGLRAAWLQVFQNGGSYSEAGSERAGLRLAHYVGLSESERNAMLDEHLDLAEQHGCTGIFMLIDNWDDGAGLPSLDRFRLFDWLAKRAWSRGLHLHTWMWSENNQFWFHPDFYRYMGARSATIGSWSADPTWDTSGPDGDMPLQMYDRGHPEWCEHLQIYFPYHKMLGVRSNANRYHSYISNDITGRQLHDGRAIEGYPAGRIQDPYHVTRWIYDELPLDDMPHFYMERHWLGRSWNADETVRAFWEFTLAGGAPSVWGFGDDDAVPYPGFERMAAANTFLLGTERWRLDLEAVDGRSSAHMMANPGFSEVLLYQRGTDQITVDLSGSPTGLPVVALDTESLTYAELDLGTAGGGSHTIDLPTTSNWAVAIGHFSDPYRVRQIDAGADRFIRDASGNGWAGVDLQAVPDEGITGVTWSWSGGSASGTSVQLDLPLGEHAITCTGSNPDGPDAVDTVFVRVIDSVESGVVYVVGTSTWFEGEDLTIGPDVAASNEWRVGDDPDADGMPTSQGVRLQGRGDVDTRTDWADAQDASITIDVAASRTLQVFGRIGNGKSRTDHVMVGLEGEFHGAADTAQSKWYWAFVGEPITLPAGRSQLNFRQAFNADIDKVHLGIRSEIPSMLGGTTPALTDEDAPGQTVGNPPVITTGPTVDPSPVTGDSATVSVGAQDPDGDDALLTAQWSVVTKPAGAATPVFAENGTAAALATTVTFFAAGSYTFAVLISDQDGAQATAEVALQVEQSASSLQISP